MLKILLESIITRCQKAQEVDRGNFEKEREEWTQEMLLVASTSQSLQGEVRELTNQIAELQSRLQEQAVLQDKVAGLEDDVTRLQRDNNQLQSDSAKLVKEYQNKLQALELSIAAKEAEVSSIEKEIDEFKTKVAALEGRMALLSVEKQTVEYSDERGQVESLKLALETSTKENTVLKLRVESLETLEKIVEAVQLQRNDLQSKIESLELSLSQSQMEKTTFQQEIKSATGAVDEISNNYFCEEGVMPVQLSDRILYIHKVATQRFQALDQENNSLRSLVTNLENDLTHRLLDENNTKKENGKALTMVEEKGEMIKKQEAKIADLMEEKSHLDELLKKREQQVGLNNTLADSQNEKFKLLMDRFNKLEEERETERTKLVEEKNNLAESHEAQLQVLKLKISQLENDKTELECTVKNLTESVAKSHEDLARTAALLAEKQELVAKHEKEMAETLTTLVEENTAKTAELNNCQHHVEALHSKIADVEKVKAELQDELKTTKERGDRAVQEMATKEDSSLKQEMQVLREKCEIQQKQPEQPEDLLHTDILLKEQILLVEAKENEIQMLKKEYSKTVQHLKSLLEEKEKSATDLKQYGSELEAEIEKGKKDGVIFEALNCELADLKQSLSLMKDEAEKSLSRLQTLTAEKACLENNLAAVEEINRTAQHRLLEAELRNNQFETELNVLKEELFKNKNLVERLNEEVQVLTMANNDFSTEKMDLVNQMKELTQSRDSFKTEKETLANDLDELIKCRETFTQEKAILLTKLDALTAASQELTLTVENYRADKLSLSALIQELTQSRDAFQTEKGLLRSQLEELSHSRDALQLEKDGLANQLEAANVRNTELQQLVEEYKSTEAAILRKLEEKQKCDETALRLRAELVEIEQKLAELKATSENRIDALNSQIEILKSDLKKKAELVKISEMELVASSKEVRDLEEAVRNLIKDKNDLNVVLEKKGVTLDEKEKSLRELTTFVKDLEDNVWRKEEESLLANNLLSQRAQVISDLNTKMNKLNAHNTELYQLLEQIQKTLQLPDEAILNLSADTTTNSFLRLFRENVEAAQQEMDVLRKQNVAMLEQQERLSVEVERLTSEKVHFEIKVRTYLLTSQNT